MNRTVEVPLLTKEGSGEVWNAAVLNLPLAPSVVRRGVHWSNAPRARGQNLRVSGILSCNNDVSAHPEEAPSLQAPSRSMP